MRRILIKAIFLFAVLSGWMSCGNKLEQKGFAVTRTEEDESKVNGIVKDSLGFPTRPSNVLLTGNPRYRLATIYKVNFNKDSTTFIGSNDFYYNYQSIGDKQGNQWNHNFMPGLETVYGYNLVNVSHFDIETQKQKFFFEKTVLIKTVYFPSFCSVLAKYGVPFSAAKL